MKNRASKVSSRSGGPYREAASLLLSLLRNTGKGKSLKTLAFGGSQRTPVSKSSYATVCKTLEHKKLIDEILSYSPKTNKKLLKNLILGGEDGVKDIGLAYILLYELLFGKFQRIRGGGHAKRIILQYEDELRAFKQLVLKKNGPVYVVPKFPRYVRINTLKADVNKVVDILRSEFRDRIYMDRHVPNLLVLPPGTDLHTHTLVKNGELILQDKSSCFSALALAYGSDSSTIIGDSMDACASPGNKTTHLAALFEDTASRGSKSIENRHLPLRLYALDRDSSRVKILRDRVGKLTSETESNIVVESLHADFLNMNPEDKRFANLRSILLDPSCSGSGIVSQPDRIGFGDDDTDQRIESLSNFQITALKHAMSFPQVKRIVYSTCSIHDKENENVVATCLKEVNSNGGLWRLVSPISLKSWSRRGKVVSGLTEDQSQCLIRCDARLDDDTNGFFVACFEREEIFNEKKNKYKLEVPRGLSIYDNQFKDKVEINSKSASGTIPCEDDDESPESSKTSGKEMDCVKKKAKKIKWKQKQAMQKAERLRRKREADTQKMNQK